MPREARKKCESGYYHVVQRGIDRQILFEDEADCERFLACLQRYRAELGFELIAYCLMGNHFHLLIHDVHDQLDLIMKKLSGSYAWYYNHRYDRIGHLFQDRYRSEAIEDDAYLLSVIRYIHRNPEKAGIAMAKDYRWSSYGAYVMPDGQIDNENALAMIGGRERFEAFMASDADEACLDIRTIWPISDAQARGMICKTCGVSSGTQLQQLDKAARDAALRELKAQGLSIRQIERLTGINRGVIQKA